MIIDFSNPWIFLLWYIITVALLYVSYRNKKSIFSLITIIYFLIILWITTKYPYLFRNMFNHRVFNFLGLAAGLTMYLIIDEIETRRKVITKVFKNRYNKEKDVEKNDKDEKNKE